MTKLRIGIAGGCLNTGWGLIPLSSVYHRVLAKRMGADCGVKLRVNLGSLETPDPAAHLSEVRRILQTKQPDCFIYQIRPEFVWQLNTLFWKRRDHSGIPSALLNSLHKKISGWTIKDKQVRAIGKLRRSNWLAARATGVSSRAWRCLDEMLRDIRELCRTHNAKLAVLGSIYGNWYLRSFSEQTENRLKSLTSDLGLAYIELARELAKPDHGYWFNDGRHLTADGHAKVAELVFPFIRDWAHLTTTVQGDK